MKSTTNNRSHESHSTLCEQSNSVGTITNLGSGDYDKEFPLLDNRASRRQEKRDAAAAREKGKGKAPANKSSHWQKKSSPEGTQSDSKPQRGYKKRALVAEALLASADKEAAKGIALADEVTALKQAAADRDAKEKELKQHKELSHSDALRHLGQEYVWGKVQYPRRLNAAEMALVVSLLAVMSATWCIAGYLTRQWLTSSVLVLISLMTCACNIMFLCCRSGYSRQRVVLKIGDNINAVIVPGDVRPDPMSAGDVKRECMVVHATLTERQEVTGWKKWLAVFGLPIPERKKSGAWRIMKLKRVKQFTFSVEALTNLETPGVVTDTMDPEDAFDRMERAVKLVHQINVDRFENAMTSFIYLNSARVAFHIWMSQKWAFRHFKLPSKHF